jgi:hypothetical protein
MHVASERSADLVAGTTLFYGPVGYWRDPSTLALPVRR